MRSETSSQNKFMSKTKDHITYYVQGMHCAACESLIEKAIKEKDGVSDVKASLKNKKIDVFLNDNSNSLNINEINNDLKYLGYTFTKEKPEIKPINKKQKSKSLVIAAFVILVFIIIERSGSLRSFYVSGDS